MAKKRLICKTCGCKTTNIGHLCDPKKVTKNTKIYICAECGLITTEDYLLCKPKLLRLK
jgi:hypothetical protein